MGEFRVHHIRFFNYQPLAIHCIDYNKELNRVAVSRSDASIEIWSIGDDWYQEKIIPGSESRSVEAICWQGSRLFSAGLDGNVTEYDLKKLKPKELAPSNAGPIWCLCKCATQQLLAAGTEDGCVVVFSTQDDTLMYHQAFDKQEGRILSIAWHPTEDLIVTGGVDNIRIWSMNSGHAIQRLTLGRQERNKETIVWCVAVTSDFTIISGDSRGKTSFWNGKQGTLIKTYQSHKADVLCLTLNEEENKVYTSGVDPSIVAFEYTPANIESDWKLWVKSDVYHFHTHDVRDLVVAGDKIVSGGVDTNLVVAMAKETKGVKHRRKYPGFPSYSMVKVASEAKVVMLQYANYLEVWKLGHTTKNSDKSGEILPLMSKPIKLLQLKTKDSERIVCCAINKTAEYLAYSDPDTVKIYSLSMDNQYAMTPQVTLKKVKSKSSLSPAHRMQFTHDGRSLITVTDSTEIQAISLEDSEAIITATIPPLSDDVDSVHLLCVSPDDKMVCLADHTRSILIFNLEKQQIHCRLPRYSCQATAVCFNADGSNLLIAYADQKIYEYNLETEEYTTWCKQTCLKYPKQWLTRHSKIINIQQHPNDQNKIIFHDEQMLCVLDKSQRFPPVEAPLFSYSAWQHQDKIPSSTAFHISSKYKFLLHLEAIQDNWLVAVERTPLTLTESLPPTLKEKKFGT
ncbi:U3 small nucleolar RNA-associated protein 4 homolog [Mytilus trossulus]|uniref:U3 small nucleolar RNA-associated protein 4 homolog n=1 Tax=Mytilus trossulus TaxID=6551 RepID=UPI003006A606